LSEDPAAGSSDPGAREPPKLEEQFASLSKLLAQAEEELLSNQVSELADLVDVVAPSSSDETA
jgi:hypothetical protein